MTRNLKDPQAKLLNHIEFVYAPGDRELVRRLFLALGCRVVDPQRHEVSEELGPAAGPYLIVYLDPADPNPFDNVFYASEVTPIQWAFEERVRAQLGADTDFAQAHSALRDHFLRRPQAMTHLGMAFPSVEAVEAAVERLRGDEELAGRSHISPIYRPGEDSSLDDRVVQAFVHTDVCSSGLLSVGQQFELQVRIDL